MKHHTILGAGGVVANELARILVSQNRPVQQVTRIGVPIYGAASVKADITIRSQAMDAIKDSTVVYIAAGLKYDHKVWTELWPRIMTNTIEACKAVNAKLVFLDNVYSYGRTDGPMTESTPYRPCSKKGEIRAQIATKLMDETKSGNLKAMIARSADFYGPKADKTGVPNILIFQPLAQKRKPSWIVNDQAKHSFTFTPDIAPALAALSESDETYGQVWHLPSAQNPFTGKQFISQAAHEFGAEPRYRLLSKRMIKMMGLFEKTVAELYEMSYQNEYEYVFDSSKIEKAFGLHPTPYTIGIRKCAEYYKQK